jgi:hypothetical protein
MIMPSYTTLPESMLDSQAVQSKFQSATFAGLRGLGMRGVYAGEGLSGLAALGCDCEDLDDSGNCLDPECCPGDPGCGTSAPSSGTCVWGGSYPNCNPEPSDCAYGGTYPNCNPAPSSGASPSTGSSVICPSGQVLDTDTEECVPPGQTTGQSVQQFCSSQGLTYNASTELCNVPAGQTLTTSQQLALDQAIVNSGSSLAKILAAGATGVTVLPNGTVIGSAATGSTLATLSSSLSSFLPVLLIGVVAVVALKAFK